MTRGKRLASYSCTKCKIRNLTKLKFAKHEKRHKIEKFTACLLTSSIRKRAFTGKRPTDYFLSFIKQCRVVIENASTKDEQQHLEENIYDTGFQPDFDFDFESTAQSQNEAKENNEKHLITNMYELIKNESRSNCLPLEIKFDKPTTELAQQDSMNLKFYKLLQDNNVSRNATENVVNFLNKEVYNRNIYGNLGLNKS